MPENIEIVALEVVSQAFSARPSALPEVRDFVRRRLSGRRVSDDDVRLLCERVADVLLAAAGSAGVIQVSLRIFGDEAEVDVLFEPAAEIPSRPEVVGVTAPAPARRPARAGPAVRDADADPAEPASFAVWLAARLRREGLSMEAAARRLDVSTKTISRWVGGTTEPRLRDLYRIRAEFGEPFH